MGFFLAVFFPTPSCGDFDTFTLLNGVFSLDEKVLQGEVEFDRRPGVGLAVPLRNGPVKVRGVARIVRLTKDWAVSPEFGQERSIVKCVIKVQ